MKHIVGTPLRWFVGILSFAPLVLAIPFAHLLSELHWTVTLLVLIALPSCPIIVLDMVLPRLARWERKKRWAMKGAGR